MVSLLDSETLQTVGGGIGLHIPGSRGMEGAII